MQGGIRCFDRAGAWYLDQVHTWHSVDLISIGSLTMFLIGRHGAAVRAHPTGRFVQYTHVARRVQCPEWNQDHAAEVQGAATGAETTGRQGTPQPFARASVLEPSNLALLALKRPALSRCLPWLRIITRDCLSSRLSMLHVRASTRLTAAYTMGTPCSPCATRRGTQMSVMKPLLSAKGTVAGRQKQALALFRRTMKIST